MHALTLCPERHDSCTSDNEHQLNSVRTHAKSEQQIIYIFMPYSVRTHAQSEQQIIFMLYSVRTHASQSSKRLYIQGEYCSAIYSVHLLLVGFNFSKCCTLYTIAIE